MKWLLPCLLACVFATGCQTVVPLDRATVFYDRAAFPEKFQQDTGVIDEPILQHGRCHLHLATPEATITTNARFCTYVMTKHYLLIQEWDIANTKYTQFMRVDFSRLTSVDLASFVRMKQVKLREPQRLTAISAVIDEGGYVDGEATERMFQMLKAQGIPTTGDNKLLTTPAVNTAPTMIPIIIPTRR